MIYGTLGGIIATVLGLQQKSVEEMEVLRRVHRKGLREGSNIKLVVEGLLRRKRAREGFVRHLRRRAAVRQQSTAGLPSSVLREHESGREPAKNPDLA